MTVSITYLFVSSFKIRECFLTTIGILCSNLCARKMFGKGEQRLISKLQPVIDFSLETPFNCGYIFSTVILTFFSYVHPSIFVRRVIVFLTDDSCCFSLTLAYDLSNQRFPYVGGLKKMHIFPFSPSFGCSKFVLI